MGEGLRVELRLVQRFGGWGWPCVVQRDSRQLHVKQYCKAINKQIHPSRPVHSNIKAVHAPCAPSSTTHPHACSASQRPCTLPITCPITLSALAGVVAYMPVFMLCARQTRAGSRAVVRSLRRGPRSIDQSRGSRDASEEHTCRGRARHGPRSPRGAAQSET